ncbi:MAG: hypothetical protein F6K54_07090 [Okeania sp. SIO3B5]|uniref:hypothetical protein n=1 Tax=Okeania sp. SIO3B5 TaxID=2607811 RepID=UPI001401A942|nr:hypothetical protein [Okeania sp. SIO3B5]NEO52867.1 hypothetical protein [Okeania sp. SIO3B5]
MVEGRQKAKGRRQEAGGRRQEAEGFFLLLRCFINAPILLEMISGKTEVRSQKLEVRS